MPFHLSAYFGAITTSGVRQFLPPVTDMYIPSTATGLLLPTALRVVAAYATSPAVPLSGSSSTGATMVSGLQNARINSPSLLRVAYPYIRPISNNLGENTDPNVMNLVHRPLALPASEAVGIEVVSGLPGQVPTGPQLAVALLWFCEGLTPVPPGEHFTLRFSTTSASPTVAGVWSPVGSITFDQSLPPGNYTVIGFEHWSQQAVAARLLFPGMAMRPGALSVAGPTTGGVSFQSNKRPERLFFEGGVGVYGMFNSFAPPSIEVLAGPGDTVHEGYLTVIRTGDINTNLQQQQGPHAPGLPGAFGAPGAYSGGNPGSGPPAGAAGMHHQGAHHQHHHHQGAHHGGPLTATPPQGSGSGPSHTF